jgi:hypothetical protein
VSELVSLEVTLNDANDLYTALLGELQHCERQVTGSDLEMRGYWSQRLERLGSLASYLRLEREKAYDAMIGAA